MLETDTQYTVGHGKSKFWQLLQKIAQNQLKSIPLKNLFYLISAIFPQYFIQNCRIKNSFPACYFISNSKLCLQRAITVQIRSLLSNLLQSFQSKASFRFCSFKLNLKLPFQVGVTISIQSFVFNLLSSFKFEKLRFQLGVATQIRSFLSSLLLKLKFEALFPNYKRYICQGS